MQTWTCNSFEGHYPVGSAAVVSAEHVDIAIWLLESDLKERGLTQEIKREQMIPLPRDHRYCRVLCDGVY